MLQNIIIIIFILNIMLMRFSCSTMHMLIQWVLEHSTQISWFVGELSVLILRSWIEDDSV